MNVSWVKFVDIANENVRPLGFSVHDPFASKGPEIASLRFTSPDEEQQFITLQRRTGNSEKVFKGWAVTHFNGDKKFPFFSYPEGQPEVLGFPVATFGRFMENLLNQEFGKRGGAKTSLQVASALGERLRAMLNMVELAEANPTQERRPFPLHVDCSQGRFTAELTQEPSNPNSSRLRCTETRIDKISTWHWEKVQPQAGDSAKLIPVSVLEGIHHSAGAIAQMAGFKSPVTKLAARPGEEVKEASVSGRILLP